MFLIYEELIGMCEEHIPGCVSFIWNLKFFLIWMRHGSTSEACCKPILQGTFQGKRAAKSAIVRSTCHMRSQWQQTSLREKNVLFDEEWPPWEHFVWLQSSSYASAISLKPYKHGHIGGGSHQLHIGRWQTPPLVSDVVEACSGQVGINSQVFVIRPRARLQTRTADILSLSA